MDVRESFRALPPKWQWRIKNQARTENRGLVGSINRFSFPLWAQGRGEWVWGKWTEYNYDSWFLHTIGTSGFTTSKCTLAYCLYEVGLTYRRSVRDWSNILSYLCRDVFLEAKKPKFQLLRAWENHGRPSFIGHPSIQAWKHNIPNNSCSGHSYIKYFLF